MKIPLVLKVDFMLTTPAFLGNAAQKAALRPQSFKGLLRHWHRAIDSHIMERDGGQWHGTGLDDRIWGGTDKDFGQSRVLLRIGNRRQPEPEIWRWNRDKFAGFSTGSGKNLINGALYLGYPFGLRGNESRTALASGTTFTLEGVILSPDTMDEKGEDDASEKVIKGILASFWLPAMLGSCGTRSRRGFGGLQSLGWSLENSDDSPLWKYLFRQLPVPGKANSPEAWREELDRGLAVLREWFPAFPPETAHPHIGQGFRPILLPPCPDWQSALALAGEKMQRFRRKMEPDYSRVRALLDHPGRGGHQAPQRCSFGLPLTFRFTSGKNRGPVQMVPVAYHEKAGASNRFASLLTIRVIRLGVRWYPMMFCLQGLVPGLDLAILGSHRGSSSRLASAGESALEQFYATMIKETVI